MFLFRFVALLGPMLLFVAAAVLTDDKEQRFGLWVGAGVLLGVAVAVVGYYRSLSPPLDAAALTTHVSALGWLWTAIPAGDNASPVRLLLEAVLLLVPVAVIAVMFLIRSGAVLFRRAQRLSERLTAKADWPKDLGAIRDIPLVKEFRDALPYDALPALNLLSNQRPEVRLAALAALEYRNYWRPGQVESVLNLIQKELVPEVRVAAVNAIANVNDRRTTELLAESLHDNDGRVRQAAADALFWDPNRRWHWMRQGARTALAEPKLHDSGPLVREGQSLPTDAVPDITAWAAERGTVSVRAAQTLAVHYVRALQEHPEEIRPQLTRMVEDSYTPPLLRIQLAKLLCNQKKMDPQVLDKLLDAANPVPLRQLAAEMTLARGWNAPAVNCLREIARLPNRELALDTARIVQQSLNVDLGLAIGQNLPPPNSPKAAEITRRLLVWATKTETTDNALDTGYKPPVG